MAPPRAAAPGQLRGVGHHIGGVKIPSGHFVRPDPTFSDRSGPIVDSGWITDKPVRRPFALWRELRRQFPATGLWPVILASLEDSRPWGDGELDPVGIDAIDRLDPHAVFAQWWADVVADDEEQDPEVQDIVAPYGRAFPGMARAGTSQCDISSIAVKETRSRIGLVASRRPADVPGIIGWTGPTNHTDTGSICAALRSWEDRFAAEVVSIGFDTLGLLVGCVPATMDEALPIAAEHFAFCPDNVWQGTETLGAYAQRLIDERYWTFWWD